MFGLTSPNLLNRLLLIYKSPSSSFNFITFGFNTYPVALVLYTAACQGRVKFCLLRTPSRGSEPTLGPDTQKFLTLLLTYSRTEILIHFQRHFDTFYDSVNRCRSNSNFFFHLPRLRSLSKHFPITTYFVVHGRSPKYRLSRYSKIYSHQDFFRHAEIKTKRVQIFNLVIIYLCVAWPVGLFSCTWENSVLEISPYQLDLFITLMLFWLTLSCNVSL